MIVTKIALLFPRQRIPIIPATPIPLLVLRPQPNHVSTHGNHGKKRQCKLRSVARPIVRRFRIDKQATSDQAAGLAQPNRRGRSDGCFPEPADVVDDESVHERHTCGGACYHQVQGEVLGAHGYVVLTEVDDPAGKSDAVAEHGKGVAVFEVVGNQGEDQGTDSCGHEDGDTEDLVVASRVGRVELGDYRW